MALRLETNPFVRELRQCKCILTGMEDMRGLVAVVVIFLLLVCDIVFNDAGFLSCGH